MENLIKSDNAKVIEIWIFGRKIVNNLAEIIENEFKKLFWITYRSNFVPLDSKTQLTSDKGWGCTIRCGQMLLANIFSVIQKESSKTSPQSRNAILEMFLDKPSADFSIHEIVKMGVHSGIPIGDQYGVVLLSNTLKNILNKGVYGVKMYIIQDGIMYLDDIKSLMSEWQDKDNVNTLSQLLVVLPYHLPTGKTLKAAVQKVMELFELPSFVGSLGGYDHHSLYFYGKSKNKLLFLDPHTTQKTELDVEKFKKTCVCDDLRQIKANYINGSLTLNFLFKTEEQLVDWSIFMKQKSEFFISKDGVFQDHYLKDSVIFF